MTTKTKYQVKNIPQLAVHAYRSLAVQTPAGATPKDMEDPAFWTHIARSLQPGDEIRCLADDSTYVATVFITLVVGNDVRARVTSFTDLGELPDAELSEDYRVMNGGATGYWIKDMRTGDPLFDKRRFTSVRDARNALDSHLKAMAA